MNPIVVIGFVAMVAVGIYGIYAGIQQQAELGEVQRIALERSAEVNAPNLIKGELDANWESENQTAHIIITNNNPKKSADLIQIRAYDNKSKLVALSNVVYKIPPLQTMNLSDTNIAGVVPVSSEITKLLLESANITDIANLEKYTYRGVTAQGNFFNIDDDLFKVRALAAASSGGLGAVSDGAYGPAVFTTIDGTSKTAITQRGFEFYFVNGVGCYERNTTYWINWKISDVSYFSPSGATTPTSIPLGTLQLYNQGVETYNIWTSQSVGVTGGPTRDNCPSDVGIDNNPLGLKMIHIGSRDAAYRVVNPSGYNVNVDIQTTSEEITLGSSGRNDIGIRIEAPVSGGAQAVFNVEMSGICGRGPPNGYHYGCHCFTPDSGRARIVSLGESLSSVNPGVSTDLIIKSALTNSIIQQETTRPPIEIELDTENVYYKWQLVSHGKPHRGLMDWGVAIGFDSFSKMRNAGAGDCMWLVRGPVYADWKYNDKLDYVVEINGTKIANIPDGTISTGIKSKISFVPPVPYGLSVVKSSGTVEIGQAVITMGARGR